MTAIMTDIDRLVTLGRGCLWGEVERIGIIDATAFFRCGSYLLESGLCRSSNNEKGYEGYYECSHNSCYLLVGEIRILR